MSKRSIISEKLPFAAKRPKLEVPKDVMGLRMIADEEVKKSQNCRMKTIISVIIKLFQRNIGISMTHYEFLRKLLGFRDGFSGTTHLWLQELKTLDEKYNANEEQRVKYNRYKDLYAIWREVKPTDIEQKTAFKLLADSGFLTRKASDPSQKSLGPKQNWTWVYIEKDPLSMKNFKW